MNEKTARDLNPWIIDQVPRFSELEGATLEWMWFLVSHSSCAFRVTTPQGRVGELFSSYISEVELIPLMSRVHLRMATLQECQQLRGRVTPQQRSHLEYPENEMGFAPEHSFVIIESREGKFSLWARFLTLDWSPEAQKRLSQQIEFCRRPLWQGGEPLPSHTKGLSPKHTLSIQGEEIPIVTEADLEQGLSMLPDGSSEVWLTREDGAAFMMRTNQDRAWAMFLRHEDDSGFHSCGDETALPPTLLAFRLSNGQVDKIPLNTTITKAEALRGLEHFFLTGEKAPWIIWEES